MVNIKIPIDSNIKEMEITKMSHKDDKWVRSLTTYEEYLDRLSEKEINKKLKKERFVTFLVFHSGKVIQSGINASLSRDSYYYFLKIIRTAFDEIEERLDV